MASFAKTATVAKVDRATKTVFGWAIVCEKGGEPYVDRQGDHIPEDAMHAAAVGFMESGRVAKEMHAGPQRGTVVFAMPLSKAVADAFGILTDTTGLMVGVRFDDAETLSKFERGELTGFSIGGELTDYEEIDDAA